MFFVSIFHFRWKDEFKAKTIYLRWVGNHKEYDKLKNIDRL